MSRLDYVTIAIVAVCVAALIYLIYMTTNLLGDSGEPDTTSEVTTPAENEDAGDNTYYFNDADRTEADEPGTAGGDASGYDNQNEQDLNEESPASGGSTADRPKEMNTPSPQRTQEEYTNKGGAPGTSGGSASTASEGQYMVIGGTFSSEANARRRLEELKRLGYNKASIERFNREAYTVVLVDRFNSVSEAESLASELKSKGKEAFVKRKE